jgi:hypothetical protein
MESLGEIDCKMNCFVFGLEQLDHRGHRTEVTGERRPKRVGGGWLPLY